MKQEFAPTFDEENSARATISDAVMYRVYALNTPEEMLAEFRRARFEYGELAVRSILSATRTDNGPKKSILMEAHYLMAADNENRNAKLYSATTAEND